ncbi:MAG: membrane protein insertase YidC [Bdellovibrionota bacterium]
MNNNSKRMATAIVLSVLVIVMYMNMVVPKPDVNAINQQIANQQIAQNQIAQNQISQNQYAKNDALNNTLNNAPQNINQNQVVINNVANTNVAVPTKETLQRGAKKFITNVAEFEISSLGGKLISYKLKKYPVSLESKELVELIDIPKGTFYPLALIYNGKRDDFVKYNFSIESGDVEKINNDTFKIKGDAKIVLTSIDETNNTNNVNNANNANNANNSDASMIKKVISLNADSYLFDVSFPLLSENDNAWLEWQHKRDDDNKDRYNEYSILYFRKDDKKVKKVGLKEKHALVQDMGDNIWISTGYKYFTSILIPQTVGNNTRFGVDNNNFIIQGKLDSLNKNIKLYVGPKDRDILKNLSFELERSVDLGTFSIVSVPLLYLLKFFYFVSKNYGLAIILLTLFIKLLFLPLTSTSMRSMSKMAELQPKMQELKERIKEPNKLNQEVMELYKKHNINPLSGCLPILIQIPVFFGLYSALLNSISLRHSSFALWITDLSAPEKLYIGSVGVPVMILLMGVSMFVQQLSTPSAADPAQRKAMLLTPIIFTVIFIVSPFPSGLVLYWLTNNLISIIQQQILKSEGNKVSPLKGTLIGSAVIYGLGYILTLF